jgi:tetratricopeptide (TPR) repeat protein
MLAVVALTYARAVSGTFLWDDHVLVGPDSSIRQASLGQLFTMPFWPQTTSADVHVAYFRPLVLLSFQFDLALGGAPEQFHLTNVALHLLASALLACAALRLGANGGAAVVASLVWALSPRLTESVGWISGRTDVLAACLGFAALVLAPDIGARARRDANVLALLSASSLLGALMSKEVAVAFAGALIVGSLRPGHALTRASRIRTFLITACPLAVYLCLRWAALRGVPSRTANLTLPNRLLLALEALGRYAEMIVVPSDPVTSIGLVGESDLGRTIAGACVLAVGGIALWAARRRLSHGVSLGLALAIFSLAPVLHLFPMGLGSAVAADRLLYIPLAGIVVALAVTARRLSRPMAPVAASFALSLAAWFIVGTKRRLDDYRDEVRFWVVATECSHPRNVVARNVLAGVLMRTDEVALACRLYESSRDILAARGLTGALVHRRSRENLASCWAREGRYEDALRLSEDLAREHPTVGRIRLALGYARLHMFDVDGAEKAWRDTLALDPSAGRIAQIELDDLGRTRTNGRCVSPKTEGVPHADARRFAECLDRNGRIPEAEHAFMLVAEDPASTESGRRDAIRFLVRYGHVEVARRALARWNGSGANELASLESTLRTREALQATAAALRPRIHALATASRPLAAGASAT